MILAFSGISVGLGFSARIPLTELNVSFGGALGKKEVVKQTLPDYLNGRLIDNTTFFNHSNSLTIWLAEGITVVIFGYQPEAPVLDLTVNLKR